LINDSLDMAHLQMRTLRITLRARPKTAMSFSVDMPATLPSAAPSLPVENGDATDAARCDRSRTVPLRRTRLRADSLFCGANEIEIQHGEAIYRLRITSLGKLILTK
jgi:hemin uptake protein HemP